MGLHFGQLYKLRGIIFFKLSPHEQKAFTGLFSHSVGNVFRRIRSNIFKVSPPFILGYAWYDWANKEHHRLSRKNPKDFENDV